MRKCSYLNFEWLLLLSLNVWSTRWSFSMKYDECIQFFLVSQICNVYANKIMWLFDISMPAPNSSSRWNWAFFGPFSTFGPMCAPSEKLLILKIVLRVRKHVTTYVTQFFITKHKKCRFEANKVRFLLIFIYYSCGPTGVHANFENLASASFCHYIIPMSKTENQIFKSDRK